MVDLVLGSTADADRPVRDCAGHGPDAES